MGENIFVQSADRATDGFTSLQDRAEGCAALKPIVDGKKTDPVKYAEAACREWIDVRTFGQVFAFKDISVGVRGPVSIQPAISVSPINIVTMQITKSVNGEDKKGRSSDTMGKKHSVDFGMYVIYGGVNCQLAEKTGFSAEDAALLKEALKTLFENDCSSARPEGSMEVCRLYWWEHDSKTPKYSSAKVHRQLKVHLKEGVQRPASFWDYEISLDALDGLNAEVFDLI